MKVVIDIPNKIYNSITKKNALGCDTQDIKNIIRNGTPLSNNATNGEVVMALFPNTESRLDENTGIMLVKWVDGTTKTFKANWWNAPYKKGAEE